MLVLLGILRSPLGKIAILAFAAALIAGVAFRKGINIERSRMLAATVEAYKKRSAIDDNLQQLDDFQLCLEFGGLSDDECNELRRVETQQPGAGNGGLPDQE